MLNTTMVILGACLGRRLGSQSREKYSLVVHFLADSEHYYLNTYKRSSSSGFQRFCLSTNLDVAPISSSLKPTLGMSAP